MKEKTVRQQKSGCFVTSAPAFLTEPSLHKKQLEDIGRPTRLRNPRNRGASFLRSLHNKGHVFESGAKKKVAHIFRAFYA